MEAVVRLLKCRRGADTADSLNLFRDDNYPGDNPIKKRVLNSSPRKLFREHFYYPPAKVSVGDIQLGF